MSDHRTRFLQLALDADALRFGEFTLKSGRLSPYFFNAGRFDSGASLATLAACYADAVDAAGLPFDLLFGPAYKGIPLATALACEYARRGRNLPLAFNRKEAKAHGEGGTLIGAPLAGRRVLVVDDVITAGTAIREALAIIAGAGGTVAGIVVAWTGRRSPPRPTAARRRRRWPLKPGCRFWPWPGSATCLHSPTETRNWPHSARRCWPTVPATDATRRAD